MSSSSTADPIRRRVIRRLIGDERGGALAEFALGLIPLVLAFALIFEVGRAFWIHQAAIKGVRDATRYLTRVEDPSDGAAQAVARNLMLTGQQGGGGVDRWDSGGVPLVVTINGEMLTVGTNVVIQLPLSGVFTLFGGAPAEFRFSLSDTGRHYGL